jgi:hypothetical protein
MSEPETSNDDLFRGFFNGMDDLIDVVPGQSSDVFSTSLMSTKSGKKIFTTHTGIQRYDVMPAKTIWRHFAGL